WLDAWSSEGDAHGVGGGEPGGEPAGDGLAGGVREAEGHGHRLPRSDQRGPRKGRLEPGEAVEASTEAPGGIAVAAGSVGAGRVRPDRARELGAGHDGRGQIRPGENRPAEVGAT